MLHVCNNTHSRALTAQRCYIYRYYVYSYSGVQRARAFHVFGCVVLHTCNIRFCVITVFRLNRSKCAWSHSREDVHENILIVLSTSMRGRQFFFIFSNLPLLRGGGDQLRNHISLVLFNFFFSFYFSSLSYTFLLLSIPKRSPYDERVARKSR